MTGLIRCPKGHILGAYRENGRIEIRHKGRTAVVSSQNATVEITCEQCGKTVMVRMERTEETEGGTE